VDEEKVHGDSMSTPITVAEDYKDENYSTKKGMEWNRDASKLLFQLLDLRLVSTKPPPQTFSIYTLEKIEERGGAGGVSADVGRAPEQNVPRCATIPSFDLESYFSQSQQHTPGKKIDRVLDYVGETIASVRKGNLFYSSTADTRLLHKSAPALSDPLSPSNTCIVSEKLTFETETS
jgi:hypothetical protein